jgi:hypothetical protein
MDRRLPPRSEALVAATPVYRMRSGVKACVELVMYPDGDAGIAVCRIDGTPPNRRLTQADSLPLNHRRELEDHLTGILDRLESEASSRAGA